MATLKLNCQNQSFEWETEPAEIMAGNIRIDDVTFSFCPLWDGFTKAAVFYKAGKAEEAVHILLDENNTCIIPPEVTDTQGLIYIGVLGVDNEGRQRTTEPFAFYFYEGIPTESKPSEPTPDIYAQIVTLCNDAVNTANSVREDADNGAFNGKDGTDGKTPVKGVDYFTEAEKEEFVNEVLNALPNGDGVKY